MGTEQTAELVKAARDAVAGIEEPLRTEAFKIVLERLLAGDGKTSNRGSVKVGRHRANSRPKAARAKTDREAVIPPSQLRLSVEELQALKGYCAGFDLKGAELTAFVLANFAREHTNLESVNANDIAYLHRQLISQKVKVPAVRDVAAWSEALGWLTVPSRKREWLERSGVGFVVSNSGLIAWNEMEEQKKKKAASGGPS